MNEDSMYEPSILYEIFMVLKNTVILLGATVVISVIYKEIINIDIFRFINDFSFKKLVFSVVELFLLALYWYYLYDFSTISRFSSRNLKIYYIRTCIVYVIFVSVYWLIYFIFKREVFMWVFRITLNLIGFRLEAKAPENLLPYMFAFLALTAMIMFLEPIIEKLKEIRYQRWVDKMES